MLSCGIVGLPNVGKSTLFNALLKKQQALAANYPFATIEPNVGIVPVPDERLDVLARITAEEIASPRVAGLAMTDSGQARMTRGERPPIKPATVEFVDIAGLVKGASEGAGLGNKFLSHIHEVSIICHVVRAFADPTAASGQAPIIREGSVDPKSDYETIRAELMLADLQSIEKAKMSKDKQLITILDSIESKLNQGIAVRDMALANEQKGAISQLFLLSGKPEIVVLNVSEEDYNEDRIPVVIRKYRDLLGSVIPAQAGIQMDPRVKPEYDSNMVVVSAQIESELASLSDDEQKEYLKGLGLKESGLERLIKKAYETLGLISFLTAGEKEVRAWTIEKGTKAVDAAGVIHTDFSKKFIKAEVVSYDDFVLLGGWKMAREVGKARLEGRDYIMQDGDVVEFKIGT